MQVQSKLSRGERPPPWEMMHFNIIECVNRDHLSWKITCLYGAVQYLNWWTSKFCLFVVLETAWRNVWFSHVNDPMGSLEREILWSDPSFLPVAFWFRKVYADINKIKYWCTYGKMGQSFKISSVGFVYYLQLSAPSAFSAQLALRGAWR